jgi:hypothetical protein
LRRQLWFAATEFIACTGELGKRHRRKPANVRSAAALGRDEDFKELRAQRARWAWESSVAKVVATFSNYFPSLGAARSRLAIGRVEEQA